MRRVGVSERGAGREPETPLIERVAAKMLASGVVAAIRSLAELAPLVGDVSAGSAASDIGARRSAASTRGRLALSWGRFHPAGCWPPTGARRDGFFDRHWPSCEDPHRPGRARGCCDVARLGRVNPFQTSSQIATPSLNRGAVIAGVQPPGSCCGSGSASPRFALTDGCWIGFRRVRMALSLRKSVPGKPFVKNWAKVSIKGRDRNACRGLARSRSERKGRAVSAARQVPEPERRPAGRVFRRGWRGLPA